MPRRKRPDRRQGRGTADLKAVPDLANSRDTPAPPRIDGRQLLKVTRDAWDTYWASELPAYATDSDRPALVRLFTMYDLRERMQRTLLADGPFTTGSTGQLVSHPAAKELAALDARIVALEDRFGLSPKARLGLGIDLGRATRSLEGINAGFTAPDEADRPDPRVTVVDTTADG